MQVAGGGVEALNRAIRKLELGVGPEVFQAEITAVARVVDVGCGVVFVMKLGGKSMLRTVRALVDPRIRSAIEPASWDGVDQG